MERFLLEINHDTGAKITAITVYEIFRRRSRMSKSEEMVFTFFLRNFHALPLDSYFMEKVAMTYEKLEKSVKR